MTEPPQQPPTPPPRRLYWMSGAPSSWRVLLALELKHLPYEAIRLDASQGETHTEEFLNIAEVRLMSNCPWPAFTHILA